MAESAEDVKRVLGRVVGDFQVVALRVREMEIGEGSCERQALVGDTVECGVCVASWSGRFMFDDPTLEEERRAILCDLLRQANDCLVRLELPGCARPQDQGHRLTREGTGRVVGPLPRREPPAAAVPTRQRRERTLIARGL